jgi:hypothetical protein
MSIARSSAMTGKEKTPEQVANMHQTGRRARPGVVLSEDIKAIVWEVARETTYETTEGDAQQSPRRSMVGPAS